MPTYPGETIRTISVIILAGGKSSRFGRDKATEPFRGETLLQRVVRRLSPLGGETIVVRGRGQKRLLTDLPPGVREMTDVYPGKGPLGGIYTGLLFSTSFHSLVVGCDMPFLNLHLIHYMVSVAEGFDVVMPRIGGKTEALHALYSKNCLQPVHSLIQRGEPRIVAFLDQVRVRFVEEKEMDRFDRERLSFFNINSPEELHYALELAAQVDMDTSRFGG